MSSGLSYIVMEVDGTGSGGNSLEEFFFEYVFTIHTLLSLINMLLSKKLF